MRRGEDRRGRQRLREEPRLKWRQRQQKESQIPPLRVPSSSLNLTHAVCPRSHATCLLSHTAQAHTECTNTVVLTRTQKKKQETKNSNTIPGKLLLLICSRAAFQICVKCSLGVRSTTLTKEETPLLLVSLNQF